MNESRVIALRFRPKTFDQVVGQEAIVRTLSNAIKSGQLHNAYVFAGARGVGKTTAARLLAKGLNCDKGRTSQPCGVCPSCQDISDSRSMFVVEIDAATNTGIDNVRDVIIGSAGMHPPVGKHSVFIIDEVHQLSTKAFDALLKTLEEPLPNVVFIMATTDLQKVPDTILSRCQVFEFRSIPLPKVFAELKRIAGELGVTVGDSALGMIARAGEGSMRDAESAFDQVISFAGRNISEEDVSVALGLPGFEMLRATLEAVADQDVHELLRIVDTIVTRGYDARNFCREVMTYIRNLLVVKVAGFDQELTQMPQSEAEWTTRLADRFSDQDLVRFFSILSKTEQDIRLSSQPRFQLEIGLVKMAQAARLYLIEEAINRMAAIEASLRGQSAPNPSPAPLPGGGPNTARKATYDRAGTASKVAGPSKTPAGSKTDAQRPSPAPSKTPAPSSPSSNLSSKSGGGTGAATGGSSKSEPGVLQRPALDGIAEPARAGETTKHQEAGPNNAAVQRPAVEPAAAKVQDDKTAAQWPAPSTATPAEPVARMKHPPDSAQPVASKEGADSATGFGSSGDPGQVAASSDRASAEADRGSDPSSVIEKVKRILENRKKILLSVALDHAQDVSVNEHYLMVGYDPSDAGRHYKTQIEDARRVVEEACYEALGRRLTLSASLGGLMSPPRQAPAANLAAQKDAKTDDTAPENHPAVRAIIERFNGEIIDVDVPER